MSEEMFESSNGFQVYLNRGGGVVVSCEGYYNVHDRDITQAHREYFRAEQDEIYKRWRDPELSDWVVYRESDSYIKVLNERTGDTNFWSRGEYCLSTMESNDADVARRYFEAHPKPKSRPWVDAKQGEVWLLQLRDVFDPEPALAVVGEFVLGAGYIPKLSNQITHGHRIWPEDKEAKSE